MLVSSSTIDIWLDGMFPWTLDRLGWDCGFTRWLLFVYMSDFDIIVDWVFGPDSRCDNRFWVVNICFMRWFLSHRDAIFLRLSWSWRFVLILDLGLRALVAGMTIVLNSHHCILGLLNTHMTLTGVLHKHGILLQLNFREGSSQVYIMAFHTITISILLLFLHEKAMRVLLFQLEIFARCSLFRRERDQVRVTWGDHEKFMTRLTGRDHTQYTIRMIGMNVTSLSDCRQVCLISHVVFIC